MTRWALALIPLLLACSPPSEGDGAAGSAAPAERGRPAGPRAPKPARQPAAPGKTKRTLEAGGSYYQYVDESGHVRFAASLDDVPERQRSTAGHISVSAPTATRQASRPRTAAAGEKTTRADVVLYTTESCPYCRRAVA